MFAGAVTPEDAPPGFAVVAGAIRAARAEVSRGAHAVDGAVVAELAAAVRRGSGVTSDAESRPGRFNSMLGKLLTVKALGIALPAMALTGGVAAAATGSLPGPAQSAVSGALSHVGISVPGPGGHSKNHGNAPAGSPSAPSSTPVGPDATGNAAFGLCQAFGSGNQGNNSKSTAYRNLQAAAAAKGETVAQYCAAVTPPSSMGTTSTEMHGPPSSTPGNGSVPGPSHSDNKGNSGHGNGTGSGNGTDSGLGNGSAGNPVNSVPPGPPSSTPGNGSVPASSNAGNPNSVPPGPPSSTPGQGSVPSSTGSSHMG